MESVLGAGEEIRTLNFLLGKPTVDRFISFLKARKWLTVSVIIWLHEALYRFLKSVTMTVPVNTVSKKHIITLLGEYKDKRWRRHGLYRALETFFKWESAEYRFDNPMFRIAAPKTPHVILHTIIPQDAERLIQSATDGRNKAINALLPDSGLRRTELANIDVADLDMVHRRIKVFGKGNKSG